MGLKPAEKIRVLKENRSFFPDRWGRGDLQHFPATTRRGVWNHRQNIGFFLLLFYFFFSRKQIQYFLILLRRGCRKRRDDEGRRAETGPGRPIPCPGHGTSPPHIPTASPGRREPEIPCRTLLGAGAPYGAEGNQKSPMEPSWVRGRVRQPLCNTNKNVREKIKNHFKSPTRAPKGLQLSESQPVPASRPWGVARDAAALGRVVSVVPGTAARPVTRSPSALLVVGEEFSLLAAWFPRVSQQGLGRENPAP